MVGPRKMFELSGSENLVGAISRYSLLIEG